MVTVLGDEEDCDRKKSWTPGMVWRATAPQIFGEGLKTCDLRLLLCNLQLGGCVGGCSSAAGAAWGMQKEAMKPGFS